MAVDNQFTRGFVLRSGSLEWVFHEHPVDMSVAYAVDSWNGHLSGQLLRNKNVVLRMWWKTWGIRTELIAVFRLICFDRL